MLASNNSTTPNNVLGAQFSCAPIFKMKHIILLGDSIRLGYQDIVRVELAEWAEIWAPEENGRDSRNILAHLDDWVIARAPDLVHLNCGLHDLKREFNATINQVPLDEYAANVRAG